ncbi:MAG: glycosyltransferase [Verrucomicrobiota bacterium]
MRVTHIITRLIVGGAQENTVASVLGLQRKPGFEVSLLSGPGRGPEGSLESCFQNQPRTLTFIPELVRPVHPIKDLAARRRLESILAQTRPHIVHTHSGKAGVLGRLAAARAGVPIIIHTIHGPSFGPFQGALANWLFRAAERRAAKVTTHFVSVADAMTRQYLAAGIGQPGQHSKILSGFDLTPLLAATNDPALRARLGLAPEDFVVGKIARLFKLKGHDDLIDAAPELIRRCPRMKFLLVGDGSWRGRFESRIRELGLEKHFVFTGLVPPAEIPRLAGIMDVLVHLSVREGLPRALPIALAAGKPVVAVDCDGANEACLNQQTGFLIAAGDRTALTERLLQLAGNRELCEQLGRTGREFVNGRFGTQTMVDELHELYLRLAREKGIALP